MTTPAPQASSSSRLRRVAVGILAGLAVVVILRLLLAPAGLHGTELVPPEPAPPFTLTAGGGQPVSLSDFQGRYVLLYFGYTTCPDFCPTTLAVLKQARERLGRRADDLQVLMITVDPRRDTPERLAEYMSFFDPTFIGLSGTAAEIASVADAYGIFYEAHEGTPESGYLVDHTTTLVGVDPEGNLRLFYSYGVTAEEIADDLRRGWQ